jgi:tRNA pseudouridine32 synthase/23S rRNA pseudouridine746 synthase
LPEDIRLPERFTFPFNYTPHPLSLLACEQLQQFISEKKDWEHDFGLDEHVSPKALGKMFGVLVVQDEQGEWGFLAAFSGKIGERALIPGFVPPIYNRLEEQGFFKSGEEAINAINRRVELLENDSELLALEQSLIAKKAAAESELADLRTSIKISKKRREAVRYSLSSSSSDLPPSNLIASLNRESQDEQRSYKRRSKQLKQELDDLQAVYDLKMAEISLLKQERRDRSNQLQEKLFDEYQFLNIEGETRDVRAIFSETVFVYPPAGAGDCAAPKLLQFAFENRLKPVCMAEFWWGISPPQEVRKHGRYYPACRGKCEPILGHMLQGMDVESDPQQVLYSGPGQVDIIFEDEVIAIVNKPAELLSVDGKREQTSLVRILRKMFPQASGPLLVHRLDMSTSGLMIVAKSEEIYKKIQQEFIHRRVEKRYEALLEGRVLQQEGEISLPLRVDLQNRPRQMVCYEYGKPAVSKWELVAHEGEHSRVYFYPITGRTHQLRVHAAHVNGLNNPILGDDLYGAKSERLHLHAGKIGFFHPVSESWVEFELASSF